MAIKFNSAELAWLEADRDDVNEMAVWHENNADERSPAWAALAMSMNELGRTRAWHDMNAAECWWFYESTQTAGGNENFNDMAVGGYTFPNTLADALLLIAARIQNTEVN